MNTKKVFQLSFLLFLVYSITACNKLEEKAFAQASPDNFFTSKSDVEAALVGMYRPMQVCCGGYQQDYTFALAPVSDEGDSDAGWGLLDDLTYSPTNMSSASALWYTPWTVISAANFVLDNEAKIEAVDDTPDKSFTKAALGEARFIRAMNYFQLVQAFGAVPLRTTVTKRADDANIPRTSVDSIYDLILTDFMYAETNLPATAAAGKPTKWAATAFLAKVYNTKQDFVNGLAKAKAVVASGVYDLVSDFGDIFDINNEGNSEVIFDIQFIRVDQQGMRMQYLFTGPSNNVASGGSGGWGLANIENGLYEKYTPGDERIPTTFADPTPGLATYYIGKWRDPEATLPDGHENNYIVFRYADLLLLLAEAENEVNGPNTDAYNAINLVRDRADVGDLTPGLSKAEFKEAVFFERHLELAYENWRWFDLKRSGFLKDNMIDRGRDWNDKYFLFPIPQGEIDASNGLLEQNPGY